MTLLAKVNRFAPVLCRLVAHRGQKMLSTRDIALLSGIKKSKVQYIALLASWDNVSVSDMEKFSAACGVQLPGAKRAKQFLRRRSWALLEKATSNQRRMVDKLLRSVSERK